MLGIKSPTNTAKKAVCPTLLTNSGIEALGPAKWIIASAPRRPNIAPEAPRDCTTTHGLHQTLASESFVNALTLKDGIHDLGLLYTRNHNFIYESVDALIKESAGVR